MDTFPELLLKMPKEQKHLLIKDIKYTEPFSIPEWVEEITVDSCVLPHIFHEDIDFSNIKAFRLFRVLNVTELNTSSFSDKLEILVIKDMAIYEIEDLSHLTNLKILDLENNDIDTINLDSLPNNLEVLNLNNNPIDFIDYTKLPESLREFHLENSKLKDKPEFDIETFNYSYDQMSLKICEVCTDQIYNIQPYFNKDSDGHFICETCFDEYLDNDKNSFEKKINISNNCYHCDNFDCPMKKKGEIYFKRDAIVYVDIDEDCDFMFCDECYDSLEEDFQDMTRLSLDSIEHCVYNNFSTIDNTSVDDYNIKNCVEELIDKNSTNNYSYTNIQWLFVLKHRFPNKINIAKLLDPKRLGEVFLSNNHYIIGYIVKNLKISLKTLRHYYWMMLTNGRVDTIIYLNNLYPIFFNEENMVNKLKKEELNKYVIEIIENSHFKAFRYIDFEYGIDTSSIKLTQTQFHNILINGDIEMLMYLDFNHLNYQEAIDFLIETSPLTNKNLGAYVSIEFLELLNEDNKTFDYNFSLKTKKMTFLKRILIDFESIDTIKKIFLKLNGPDIIELPFDLFMRYCKSDEIEFAKLLVELYPNKIFIELEDNEIVDYGRIGKGLFKKAPLCFKTIKPIECCICLDKLSEVITHCKHQFCKLCTKKSLDENSKCPLCRQSIDNKIYNIKN
jgi:Leucine-rich repeat (LRR) protein